MHVAAWANQMIPEK